MKRFLIIFTVISFLFSSIPPVYGYTQMPEYLCELGLNFYHQGRIPEALHEFRKALIISPGYTPALKYINMIQEQVVVPPGIAPPVSRPLPAELPPVLKPPVKRERAIERILDRIEKEIVPPVVPTVEVPELKEEEIVIPRVLFLDENIEMLRFPIEIEQSKSIAIRGENIRRFLSTQPEVLAIERISPNEISVTGKEFGHTYLHIWDNQGRWTLEFLTVPKRPPGPTYEELLRREEEKAESFKLRYSMDWSYYEMGRRLYSLDRTSYSYRHYLGLTGPSPYGNLDSFLTVQALKEHTDLTYFTLGLTEGRFGPFEGFELRSFDYSPDIYNLAYAGRQLRGVMLASPAFEKKVDYTIFWGRESYSRYGPLSPGLAESEHSFYSGLDLGYSPTDKQTYGFSVFKGWGRDREAYLNPYSYVLEADWNLDRWNLGYEVAYDSENFAQLFNAAFKMPRLRLTGELRNIDKEYTSMYGTGWKAGELGGLLTLSYAPTQDLDISSRLDIFQDRLYPSEDKENRWNTDFECALGYRLDRLTALSLDYKIYNELGRLSEYRFQDFGLGLSRTWEWVRRIRTYINYRHQESKNFTSPTLDYINDKVLLGLSSNIFGNFYYYINQDFNWLQERYNASQATPRSFETGISWNSQIYDTPFYGNLRFYYHDEENADSALSFLSGEDYIEGYSELTYRPTPEKELYGSLRVRNVWAENPDVSKRLELDLNAGIRYTWDTGFRWESIGSIEGYVFKDSNSDGLRQEEESPVEGIKLLLGKKKTAVTDGNGYYKFPPARAHKAYVSLDTQSLPPGYVLTVPVTQVARIAHNQTVRLDFGITARSEIYGIVFEDADGNARYTREDKGIKGVTLILEDGSSVTTDDNGKYRFADIAAGEHVLSVDLSTLPTEYLPLVSVRKEVTLFEGMSYNYNIPCQKQ